MRMLIGCSVAFLLTVLYACTERSGMSPGFEQAGKRAYQTLVAREQHSAVTASDVEKNFIEARTAAANDEDRKALDILEIFFTRYQVNDGSPGDKKVVAICREASRKLFDPMNPPLNQDELGKLGTIDDRRCVTEAVNRVMETRSGFSPEEKKEREALLKKKCDDWKVGLRPQFKKESCPYGLEDAYR